MSGRIIKGSASQEVHIVELYGITTTSGPEGAQFGILK